MSTHLLKHVATVRVSNVDKKSVEGQVPVRLCNYTDVYYRDAIENGQPFMSATATADQIAVFKLQPGDVVITKDSETPEDIGVPAYVRSAEADLICGYHLSIIRPDARRVDGRFLYWLMSSNPVRDQLTVAATGVTRFGLRSEALGSVKFEMWSLSRQRAIADYLDAETARIDVLVDRKASLIGATIERFRSAAEEMLLRAASRHVPLMYLTNPSRPIVYGIVQAGPQVSDGIPYIKSGDVTNFNPDLLSRTDPSIDELYRRARVYPGDIVMAMRASIGKLIMVPESLPQANLTQGTARIAADSRVDKAWLFHVLQTRFVQEQCVVRALGTTFRTLNIWDLRRLVVPVPERNEQQALAAVLTGQDAVARRTCQLLGSQVERLRERRQALITAAVTGKLEVPGAA